MKLYQSYLRCLSEETRNGICSVVFESLMCHKVAHKFSMKERTDLEKELREEIISIAKEKGWYSNNHIYPIDSGDPRLRNSSLVYSICSLWDPTAEYGLRRIHIANELANYIKSKGY